MDTFSLLITFLATLIGVIATWYFSVPNRLKNIKSLASKFKANEEWFCIWQEDTNNSKWITDKVQITKHFGKLIMEVKESGDEYKWRYEGKIVNGLLIGEFYSLRPDSISVGSAVLKFNPKGNILAGYYIGPTNKSRINIGKVILLNNLSNLERVKSNFTSYL